MNIAISRVSSQNDLKKCIDIRIKVFVEGQQVPIEEEMDGRDDESEHYLLIFSSLPVGTARVRYLNNIGKIERVAILYNYQGNGLGKKLIEYILKHIKSNPNIKRAILSSQIHAIPFYQKLGFAVCSNEYMDAGIEHRDMKIEIQSSQF